VIPLACPKCRAPLAITEAGADGSARCAACGETYPLIDGIHRFLPAARLAHYQPFLRDYTTVRLAEGRGSTDADYFRRLPEPTPGGPIGWQWAIRRRTWATVRDRVLPSLGGGLVVLDVGAGVGWLSNRLHGLGHQPHAIDLTVDGDDGLGAARHYGPPWPRYQAEMDALPFADGTAESGADIVIFNASLHYSTDYVRTVGEALRVMRPGGKVVVMDSPIYRRDGSGRQMVAERHADFERRFGTRSDSVASIEYLTDAMLGELAGQLGLSWRRYRTWYGWRWAMRPWKARLHRRRPPSRFVVLVGTRDVLR
jgi:SAM-dependent methyltransferase